MNEQEWPYKDAYEQNLDIGDLVKFVGDGPTGTVFKIVIFTIDGATALIYASPNKKYWVPTRKVVWVR